MKNQQKTFCLLLLNNNNSIEKNYSSSNEMNKDLKNNLKEWKHVYDILITKENKVYYINNLNK